MPRRKGLFVLPVEPGPRLPFGGRDLGVATRPRRSGPFGAYDLDLGTMLRQAAALLLAISVVLVVLPSFSGPAQAAGLRLYLHNYPTPPTGDTNGTRALPMNGNAPTATTLHSYNVDVFSGRSGRFVFRGSSNGPTEASLGSMVNWVFQAPENMVLDGNATGGIWVTHKDGCVHTGQFRLWLRTKNNAVTDAGTLLTSGAGPVPPGASQPCWSLVTVSMPISTTIPAGTWVELKLTVDDADRDGAMIGYDTTSFASYLDLPLVVPTPTPEPPTPTPTPEPATPTPEPATPTPEPATPTPEPATPTPEPATPTPEPATPTPEPATPTPEPATPTPEPATPTPTAPPPTPTPPPTPEPPTPPPPTEKPTPTPLEPTPTPPPPTWEPADPPPTATPPPETPTPTPPPPTPTPTAPPTATPPTPDPIPSFLPPVRPHETMPPLGELETPPPPPPPAIPPESPQPTGFVTPPPVPGPLAPLATPVPRPLTDEETTGTTDERTNDPDDGGEDEPAHQLIDLTGGGSDEPGGDGGNGEKSSFAASIAQLARTAGEAVKTFAFPLSLTILVLIFLLIQGEIDRRDPKLAFAPVDSSKDMVYFE